MIKEQMYCTCKLCGLILTVTAIKIPPSVPGDLSPEQIDGLIDIMTFDRLAAEMTGHLSKMHVGHANEMAIIALMAQKFYAMTMAAPSVKEKDQFMQLRGAWQEGLMKTFELYRAAGTVSPPDSVSNSSGSTDGSKLKSEKRKDSSC